MCDIVTDELYMKEKRVSEYYAAIGEIARKIWKIKEMDAFLNRLVELIGRTFHWHTAAVIVKHDDRLELRSFYHAGKTYPSSSSVRISARLASPDLIMTVAQSQEPARSSQLLTTFPVLNHSEGLLHYLAYPLINQDALIGVLLLGRMHEKFDDCEMDVLHDLAEHTALAMDHIAMYEERQQYLIAAERNRLAKDLHDSVNQKLFSLSLIAQGLADRLEGENEQMRTGLQEIGQLTQEALAEMKGLIWDLRIPAEDKDLPTKLSDYGQRLGLTVKVRTEGRGVLPDKVEEALWRIGQEALNNVRKHAKTVHAAIELRLDDRWAHLNVMDRGCGFRIEEEAGSMPGSFGLESMRERAHEVFGTVRISSTAGQGTTVRASIPVVPDGGGSHGD